MVDLKKAALALGLTLGALTATAYEQKVLQVGCEGGFAPFTYIDDNGSLVGFDIDMIRQIGKVLGYDKVEITVYPFDGLIPALLTDNIDLIISGFTISEERAKRVDFSDPYYLCGLTYLIDKQNEQKFSQIADLNGQEVCVQIGTTGGLSIQKILPDAIIKTYNSPAETYLELQNGGCKAVVNDRPVNDFYLQRTQSSNIISKEVMNDDKEYYGIAVNKGNHELLEQINLGLKAVLDNGQFAEISQKWFGYDISATLK